MCMGVGGGVTSLFFGKIWGPWFPLADFPFLPSRTPGPHVLLRTSRGSRRRSDPSPCSGEWQRSADWMVCCFINAFLVAQNEPVLTFAQNPRMCWNKSPDWVTRENQMCFPLTRKPACVLELSPLSATRVCGAQRGAVKEKGDLVFQKGCYRVLVRKSAVDKGPPRDGTLILSKW